MTDIQERHAPLKAPVVHEGVAEVEDSESRERKDRVRQTLRAGRHETRGDK